MKIYKLILGIVSIALSVAISVQSFLVSLSGLFIFNFFSGIAGYLLSFAMLIAGIIVLCTMKNFAGGITAGCFYLAGALIAYLASGDFPDLKLWAFISLACGVSIIVVNILEKKQKEKANPSVPPAYTQGSPYGNPAYAYNNAENGNAPVNPGVNAENGNAPVNPGVNAEAACENKTEQENTNEN